MSGVVLRNGIVSSFSFLTGTYPKKAVIPELELKFDLINLD